MSARDELCRGHFETLLDLVDGLATAAAASGARAHLDRCPRCRADLAEAVSIVSRLRRLGALERTVRPRRGGWLRFEAQLQRPKRAGRRPAVARAQHHAGPIPAGRPRRIAGRPLAGDERLSRALAFLPPMRAPGLL